MNLTKIKKWLLWFLLLYILYFIVSMYGYLYYQINQRSKTIEQEPTTSLATLNQPANLNEEVAMTSSIEDALPLRFALLDQAKATLLIAQYTIGNDDSGYLFVNKIKEAAERGVKVKLLLNGLTNSGNRSSYLSVLDQYDNIEIKRIGGLNLWQPWKINNVMHDKLIVVDDTYAMSSGRNVVDRFMLPTKDSGTLDMDIIIKQKGKVTEHSLIQQIETYFNDLWQSKAARKKKKYVTSKWQKSPEKWQTRGKPILKEFSKGYQNDFLRQLTFYPIENGIFVHNPVNQIVKTPLVWHQMTTLMAQAEKEYSLMSPYVVLNRPMVRMLPKTRESKRSIYTNSLASSPDFPAFSGYLLQKNQLKNVASIWEFQSKKSVHQKAVLIDNTVIGIGSMNLDPRSAYLSSENMLFVQSRRANEAFRATFSEYQEHSLKVKNQQEYEPSSTVKPMKVNFLKRALVKFLSWLSPLYRVLL